MNRKARKNKKKLKKLLAKKEAEFHWDGKVWCLSGIEYGLYWETDDVEAASKSAAIDEAIYFLEHGEL